MTFEELLKASVNGFPNVLVNIPVRHAASKTGKVTIIKDTPEFKGCAVRFEGIDYDSWFYADFKEDKRSKYMSELTIIL